MGDDSRWRIGGGIVIGWHARGVTQLEPRLVSDWEKFSKALPFWSKHPNR
jgi:triphosphatase